MNFPCSGLINDLMANHFSNDVEPKGSSRPLPQWWARQEIANCKPIVRMPCPSLATQTVCQGRCHETRNCQNPAPFQVQVQEWAHK